MDYAELDALEVVIADIDALIASLDPDDWQQPTRCAPMTVWDLVAHLAGGNLPETLGPRDARPTMNRSTFFRYDVQSASEYVESTRVATRSSGADAIVKWRTFSKSFLDLFRTNQPDALMRSWDGGWMTLADFAASRGVVELGVHLLDLQDALGRSEGIDERAAPIVTDVLDGLLGRRIPEELGWDATTYALVATGRRKLTDSEADVLGPLATSFPLFA